jgi:hypothetical protein
MEKYYTITTPYNATYNLIEDNKMIFIGGSKYYCISVGMQNNGDELFINSKKECVLYNKFPTIKIGDDMMYALLYYLKHTYKTCYFEFNDTSNNDTSINKKEGDLQIYYLAFTQNTWYEKFGAYLKNPNQQKIYDTKKLNFDSIDFKNINRDKFNLLITILKDENKQPFLLNIYDNSKTIKDFFNEIRIKIENKEIDFREMIYPWLEKFIKVNLGFDLIFNFETKWVIDCKIDLPKNNEYILTELIKNPFPKSGKIYMSIKKKEFYEKQYGGMKTLLPSEKELYKDPRWIGWIKYDISEFHPKDQKYLKKLMRNF